MDRQLKIISFVVAVFCVLITLKFGLQTIDEGYVGVIYRFGSLSPKLLHPGLNLVTPFLDSVYQVQVTVQTDKVSHVACGTKSGNPISFDTIEVVNQLNVNHVHEIIKNYTVEYDKPLIYRRIEHEMNQFCSQHTLQEVYIEKYADLDEMLRDALQKYLDQHAKGLNIISIRLTKPTIPEAVQRHYESIVATQTETLNTKAREERDIQSIKSEAKKHLEKMESDNRARLTQLQNNNTYEIALINATHAKKIAQIKSEEDANLSIIKSKEKASLAEIEKESKENKLTTTNKIGQANLEFDLQTINNKISRLQIDIEHYRNQKDTEIKQLLLNTNGYAEIEMYKHLFNNAKIYWGNSLPKILPLGTYNMTI